MSDTTFYDLVRGPLLKFALFIFFAGISYRFFRVVFLGLPPDYAKPKGNPYYMAVKKIVIKPTMGWTFNEIFSRRAVNFIGGFLFHLGFLGLTFFVPDHALLWREITGLPIPTMPNLVGDILAYAALGSLLALTIHRMLNPVLKLLTGKDEYFANFLIGAGPSSLPVFLPPSGREEAFMCGYFLPTCSLQTFSSFTYPSADFPTLSITSFL
ncbi:hypothetical protein [Hydrogenobacter thermophilus]|uniref:hypothetical protein n=1 Tax=Hydrogenobacter thermophilus TaxID=940 RepID=UPI0026ED162E|nr:hypothetical protein [Hydrogenobacter thermophilus]